MFGRRKKERVIEKKDFDRTLFEPVIRASICNGEKVAGFKNKKTGEFKDIMMVNSGDAMQEFLQTYGLRQEEVRTMY